ncbi:diaminopimelate decarboxylase [Endobacter medicaginis]|uniref:Diaminopimelate decarboxylase n=5 Tax=Endobacter medicaginis TaxID=1181271 RepID=A0A839UV39_9PROT|nr:diaminopimelate decarboxylase [Endobacter medicaginis]
MLYHARMDLPTLDPCAASAGTDVLLAARPWLRMDVQDGLLFDGVSLAAIAQGVGTPCWVTGADTLLRRVRTLQAAMGQVGVPVAIHFAMKSNDHLAVLALMRGAGVGMDVVSGGELARALHAGIDSAGIVFSGVGKTDAELDAALRAGIGQINVESAEELHRLSARATTLGLTAPVSLRVNPDVESGTHAKIATGHAETKFGVAHDDAAALYAQGTRLPGLRMDGLAVHIGSQIGVPAPFRDAYRRVAALVGDIRAAGHAVRRVDCGGGLGIAYGDDASLAGVPAAWAGAIATTLGGLDLALSIEPGRWLAAPAGLLLSRVIQTKAAPTPFVVLDAAMNDLARPALYDAFHAVVPVAPQRRAGRVMHLVGPVCETGDILAADRRMPEMRAGELVAILDTGAYGAVMSSTYNARPFAAQVMIGGGRWSVIRPRQPVEALWAGESVPGWLVRA